MLSGRELGSVLMKTSQFALFLWERGCLNQPFLLSPCLPQNEDVSRPAAGQGKTTHDFPCLRNSWKAPTSSIRSWGSGVVTVGCCFIVGTGEALTEGGCLSQGHGCALVHPGFSMPFFLFPPHLGHLVKPDYKSMIHDHPSFLCVTGVHLEPSCSH